MGKPAARIGDMHTCPMVTPGTPPVPHVGGPITGPSVPTVLIGGMPAAVMGDMCTCVGPPDTIIMGSMGVFIGGKPAARMGDPTVHGGMIAVGCPTVLIGEVMPGTPLPPVLPLPFKVALAAMGSGASAKAAQILTLKEAAIAGLPLCEKCKVRETNSGKTPNKESHENSKSGKAVPIPEYPTNSRPGVPPKIIRYAERMNLISSAKKSSNNNPVLKAAIARIELNNDAVERAKLADQSYYLNKDTVPEGWEAYPHEYLPEGLENLTWKDNNSGFQAEIYQSTFTMPPKYVVAFRGTDNKGGVFDDIKQSLGFKSAQYDEAVKLAQSLKGAGMDIEFTGHSLGGGLASAAGIVTKSKSYTYNAAGLHPQSNTDYGFTQKDIVNSKNNIQAFSSTRDPLNIAQDNRGLVKFGVTNLVSTIPVVGPALRIGLAALLYGDPDSIPQAAGERHKIKPPFPDELKNNFNPIDHLLEGHGMNSLIVGIEQQKEEDIKTIKKTQ
jgi:uncharacterized Zn-binding protein involved in type VI secretion